jgi:phosphoglycerate dehydrogenase-like enzyme
MNNLSPGSSDERLRAARVVFGQPHPQRLLEAEGLRFVQLNSAGWARYDDDAFRAALVARGVVFANSSSVYAEPVAEHAVAMILALARCLPEALDEQRDARGWPMAPLRVRARRLAGETVLLVGYGAIARAMTTRLRAFGCRVVGHRRRPRGDEPIEMVDLGGLLGMLAIADHVVDLLPETRATQGFFDAARLGAMRSSARFYNLGRGATVDQAALVAALRDGRLDAAYLDVTLPEPPPPDDPLWSVPRLFITPHASGGHADEFTRLVDLFLANLAAVESGREPSDRLF